MIYNFKNEIKKQWFVLFPCLVEYYFKELVLIFFRLFDSFKLIVCLH